MARSKRRLFWAEPTGGGINQRAAGTIIRLDESPLMYNMTHDKIGTWKTRKGNDLLATTISGSEEVLGLGTYRKNNGTEELYAVMNTNLYKYDGSTTFSNVASTITGSAEKVNMVNYLNRLYLFIDGSNVAYTTGGATTNVGSGGDEFQAPYGAHAQNTLWAGGVSGKENYVYASLYDETNNVPTDQFFASGGSMATSKRYFIIDGPCTGLGAYDDHILAFTKNSCWTTDIRDFATLHGPVKLWDVGTSAHRTIAVDQKLGLIMFASDKGIFMSFGGQKPINVVDKLQNKAEGTAIWDLVSTGNFASMSGGVWDGKYFLSLGDLTDTALDYYQNACVVYDIASNKLSLREAGAAIFTLFTKTGDERLYFGSASTRSVYRFDVGTQDTDATGASIDFTAYVQSKRLRSEFGSAPAAKTFHSIYTVYKGSGTIAISHSIDGAAAYTEIVDLPQSSTEVMTETKLGKKGHDISLQWKVTSGSFEIIAFGIEATVHDSTNLATT